MIENLIVFAIVAAAAFWLARRWLPGEIGRRLGVRGGSSTCADKKCGGDGSCDRCH